MLLMAAIAYHLLQQAIIRTQGRGKYLLINRLHRSEVPVWRPHEPTWLSIRRLAQPLMRGCFLNFRLFRPMKNSCTRSDAQAVYVIAETSMTLLTLWLTLRLDGLFSVNLWLTT